MKLERGTVIMANLDPTLGHEQRGRRPCVVISSPEVTAHQRFPMVCIVPVTGTAGTGALYPELSPGLHSGLSRVSYALVDHLRSLDKRRVERLLGRVTPLELESIVGGIRLFLALLA